MLLLLEDALPCYPARLQSALCSVQLSPLGGPLGTTGKYGGWIFGF